MAGGMMYTPPPPPTPGSALGPKLQKPSKESGIYQLFGTINFVFFFTERHSLKSFLLKTIDLEAKTLH